MTLVKKIVSVCFGNDYGRDLCCGRPMAGQPSKNISCANTGDCKNVITTKCKLGAFHGRESQKSAYVASFWRVYDFLR